MQYFDGVKYPVEYHIENGTLINYEFDEEAEAFLFLVNGTDAKFTLVLPKTLPFDYSPDAFNYDMMIIENRKEVETLNESTKCDYAISWNFNGETKFEMYNMIHPEGPRYVYHQVHPDCLNEEKYNTDIQKKLQEKSCHIENSVRSINARDEVVCVFSDSFNKLYHREYLKAMVGN